jgi:hypothetical protein
LPIADGDADADGDAEAAGDTAALGAAAGFGAGGAAAGVVGAGAAEVGAGGPPDVQALASATRPQTVSVSQTRMPLLPPLLLRAMAADVKEPWVSPSASAFRVDVSTLAAAVGEWSHIQRTS